MTGATYNIQFTPYTNIVGGGGGWPRMCILQTAQKSRPYWKLFGQYDYALYGFKFYFKNTAVDNSSTDPEYTTYPIFGNTQFDSLEYPGREQYRPAGSLVRGGNTKLFFGDQGLTFAYVPHTDTGVADNCDYCYFNYDPDQSWSAAGYVTLINETNETSTEAVFEYNQYTDETTGHWVAPLYLMSYSANIQFRGFDFYAREGSAQGLTLVKSFRPYKIGNQDFLYESVESKYYGPNGDNPVDDPIPTEPRNTVAFPKQLLLFRRRTMMMSNERQPVLITDLSSWFDSSDSRYNFWTGRSTIDFDNSYGHDSLWQTTLLNPLYFKSISFTVTRQLTYQFEIYDENGVQTYLTTGRIYYSTTTLTASTLVRAKTFKLYFTSGSQEYGTIRQSGYEMYG